jgi:hypothetical protein
MVVRPKNVKQHRTSVRMQRLYKDAPTDRAGEVIPSVKQMNTTVDAVMHYASSLDSVPSYCLVSTGDWIIDAVDVDIPLNESISFRVTAVARRDVSDVQKIDVELWSSTISANDIRAFINDRLVEYNTFQSQQLTSSPCIFEQKDSNGSDMRGMPYDENDRRRYEIINAPKHLSFVKYPFQSNKTFDCLCGPDARLVRDRIDFFTNNKDWYNRKGIPYRIGFLLSGDCGSGKSSCIKSIANATKRHIVNINFANIRTGTQLRHLFQSRDLHVFEDNERSQAVKLDVPIEQRVYVLEEIDAIGSKIVEDRVGAGSWPVQNERHGDELSLADILQVFDGTMETPGRIIVVTSNFPERLDKAFIRPGRIDVTINFEKASRETLVELYEKLNDKPFPDQFAQLLPHRAISIAEATEVIFRNFECPIEQLILQLNAKGGVTTADAVAQHFAAEPPGPR